MCSRFCGLLSEAIRVVGSHWFDDWMRFKCTSRKRCEKIRVLETSISWNGGNRWLGSMMCVTVWCACVICVVCMCNMCVWTVTCEALREGCEVSEVCLHTHWSSNFNDDGKDRTLSKQDKDLNMVRGSNCTVTGTNLHWFSSLQFSRLLGVSRQSVLCIFFFSRSEIFSPQLSIENKSEIDSTESCQYFDSSLIHTRPTVRMGACKSSFWFPGLWHSASRSQLIKWNYFTSQSVS